jgi:hypothetical protein
LVGSAAAVAWAGSEAINAYNESGDDDPNGPFTSDTRSRGQAGGDGARSEITTERDDKGRTTATTHTVVDDEGKVVHGHTDHVGENGSRRRFSDDLTGNETVGDAKQAPKPKDNGPRFPREPVKETSRY